MKTVAIILNYNDVDTSLKQLKRLLSYKSLDKIIMVDNASTDDSRIRLSHYVNQNAQKFLYLQMEQNKGYGAGNNAGLKLAKELGAKYALVANPDTEIADKAIEKCIQKLEAHPLIAMLGPIMINPIYNIEEEVNQPGTRENTLQGAAGFPIRPWIYDLLEAEPIKRRIFQKLLHYPREYFIDKNCVRVDAIPGALFICDIEKLLSVGGYDEEVFLYEEEKIIGSKLKKVGYQTVLYLKVHYIHRHSTTIKKSYQSILSRQKLRRKAMLIYYRKYLKLNKWQLLLSNYFLILIELECILYGLLKR